MTELAIKKQRPKHLNLFVIRLPIAGIMSFGHRVSGAFMFLLIPALLWLFDTSLGSRDSFETYQAVVAHPLTKLVLLALLWAYMHHFCAGIRYLFLDLDKGTDLAPARASAIAVFAVSIILTIAIGGTLLW